MTWQAGQSLQAGKYQIIRQLGGGGFGLTYLAEDSHLRRQVVIKMPNQMFQQDQDYAKFIRRFQQEGQALAKISHPNVVQVIELFQEQGMPCLVMAYVEGETLSNCIRRRGPLAQDQAVQCFRQLAIAMQWVHEAGLIHCDLHPGNIILKQTGEPVLIDFGSAKFLQPGTHIVSTTVNDFYTPYEQGKPESKPQPTLDVYSLAATLYFAVTGQKPASAMNRKFYGDTLQAPRQHHVGLSDWLNQAILRGMAVEASDRPPSMQEWLGLLHSPSPPKAVSASLQGKKFKKKPSLSQSQLSLPWLSLGLLTLGYLLTGTLIGFSIFSSHYWAALMPWAVAMPWAMFRIGEVLHLLDEDMGVSFVYFYLLPCFVVYFVATVGARAVGGDGAVAVVSAWVVAWALVLTKAWTLPKAVTVVRIVKNLGIKVIFPCVLALLFVAGALYKNYAWVGLGLGVLGFVQFGAISFGLLLTVRVNESVNNSFSKALGCALRID
jgi:tRNA A-37 threonylcarbamoyl transferase component Bud32